MRLFPLLSIAVLSAISTAPLRADGSYGAILAGREALTAHDFAAAEAYFGRVYAEDPDNLRYAHDLLTAQAALGHFADALPLAQDLRAKGEMSPIIGLTLLVDAATREDWAGLKELMAQGQSPVPAVTDVFTAWADVGLGNMDAAIATLDTLGAKEGSRLMAAYHKALALALAGDHAGALDTLNQPDVVGVLETHRGLFLRIELLSALERNPEALDLLSSRLSVGTQPPIDALAARLKAGEPLPFSFVHNAREGIGETLFTLVTALNEDTPATFVLAFSRAALALDPDNSDNKLITGQLLDEMGRHEDAAMLYGSVPAGDLSYAAAQLGLSDALSKLDRPDEARSVLNALAETYPNLIEAHVNLGDLNRYEDHFTEAVAAYDKAIALFTPETEDWRVYFYRGIALERLKDWTKAEPDFRKALELNPKQPQVLNYLGYAFVDQNINLDEGLDLIKRAVELSPESGDIIDSLGWAYYRLGRYAEALEPMELAVRLVSTNSEVNDHLGDVYWAIGRKREARFQWERALSYGPDEEDLDRIKRKLEVGLDQVLSEEGAKPIAPAGDL